MACGCTGTFVFIRPAFRGINRAVSYIRRLITHRCVNKTTTSQQSLVPASLEATNGIDNYVIGMTESRPSLVPSSIEETYIEMSSDEDKIDAIDEKTNDISIALEVTDGPDDLIDLFSVETNNHIMRGDRNEIENAR